LSGVSHWWCFANDLGTSSFSLLGRSCHPKLVLRPFFQLVDFQPVRVWRSLVLGMAFLSPIFYFPKNSN
jgi:hypothetical protein